MQDAAASKQINSGQVLGALKLIAEAGVIFVALAIVTGWTYTASYYNSFGISPIEIDISVQVASALALQALYQSSWLIPVGVALLVLFFTGAHHWFDSKPALGVALILILFFALSYSGMARGRIAAELDMKESTTRLPKVGLVVLEGHEGGPNCIAKGTIDCRLLLHWHGVYYVIEALEGQNLHLFQVPESQVKMAHIVRGAR